MAGVKAAKHTAPTKAELIEALEQSKLTFFYIRNLSHDAWRDPPNLVAILKRIEDYAKMEHDLLEAALRRALGEDSK